MSIALALSFTPVYGVWPVDVYRSCVPISLRFPMPGGTTSGLTIGINGTSTTYVPIRSALEFVAWGATSLQWTYADRASSLGYASTAAFVAEFTALGARVQGTLNSSAVSESTGPFAQDLSGFNFSASGASPRPPPLASPTINRQTTSISWAPANDPTGTRTPKLTAAAALLSAGCTSLHQDDPRGTGSFPGFRAHRPERDLTSQAGDFSPTAVAGFPAWLTENTTSAQRVAVGLPSSAAGLDITAWLETNYSSALHSAGQTNPALIDSFLFRTTTNLYDSLRDVMAFYARYLRDDQYAWLLQLKAAINVPLSCNFYAATPLDFMSWITRKLPKVWDYAISEIPPPYWARLSPYVVGSDAFITGRYEQAATQHLQLVMADLSGLLCLCECKPTAPNQAPARVVVQILRQSIMQTVMEGHVPMPPVDVYLSTGGGRNQGVSIDGYRFWGSTADYKSCFDFIKSKAKYIDGYEKMAIVHVAVSNDSFPFSEGDAAAMARFDAMFSRLAELWVRDVDYYLMPVGEASGNLAQSPDGTIERTAPIIICLQDTGDYMSAVGRMTGSKYRQWGTAACDEAMRYSPVRSTSPNVRAIARYNASTGRVSVHLHNYAINGDGTPKPQTTTLIWRWGVPTSTAIVIRLGESGSIVDMSRGFAQVTLTEYAIINFAVA